MLEHVYSGVKHASSLGIFATHPHQKICSVMQVNVTLWASEFTFVKKRMIPIVLQISRDTDSLVINTSESAE